MVNKIINLILLILISISTYSQGIDTIINTGFYKSYIDIQIKEPVYVSYNLYKGGGNCSRAGFNFKNDTKVNLANTKDYAGSGFDMGHLVNAADFAFDCKKDEMTFRFYNCLPQYPNLNRGIWKKWETKIRKESQTDSLLIICGGVFSNKIIGDSVYVPDYCWKIVYSISGNKITHVLWFVNTNKNAEIFFKEITLIELEDKLGYKIPLVY